MSKETEQETLQDRLASVQLRLGLDDNQWLEKFGNRGGLYGLVNAERKALLAEIEAKAPKDAQESEWSDKYQRFVLHRPEEVSGFNAANEKWRSILKEVGDEGN